MTARSTGIDVTVIIRTKNSAATLGQVLEALMAQSCRSFTVKAVDSASTDGTRSILESYRVPFEVIDASSYQPGPVLNRAVATTRTPIVVFLNSDTVPLRRDALEQLVAPVRSGGAAAAFARQVARPDALPWVKREYEISFPPQGPAPAWMEFSLPFAAIRREIWERHKFYETAWASEDTEWGHWAKTRGLRVAYVPKALVMHSHNYTFSQIWGRKFVEGEADAFIYAVRPSLSRLLKSYAGSTIRDLAACLRSGSPLEFFITPFRRLVYHLAWHKGCCLGWKRLRANNRDASLGRRVVLASHQ